MRKKQEWIEFYHQTKGILCSLSVDGLFSGEIESTKELLAKKKNVPLQSIIVRKRR